MASRSYLLPHSQNLSFLPSFITSPEKSQCPIQHMLTVTKEVAHHSIHHLELSLSMFFPIGRENHIHLPAQKLKQQLRNKTVSKINTIPQMEQKQISWNLFLIQLYRQWQNIFIQTISQICLESPKFENEKIQDAIRKKWSLSEIEEIQNKMNERKSLSQTDVEDLAIKLNRSVLSIIAKTHKLSKQKKDQFQTYQDLSLQKKIVQMLKQYPKGLTKLSMIQKLQQNFQMGEEDKWKKSAGQLLSSSIKIRKIKGQFSIISCKKNLRHKSSSLRQKIHKCMSSLPEHRGNIECILRKYNQIFLNNTLYQMQEKERKSIQSSILKTLVRYQQFDSSRSKTVYCYCQKQGRCQAQDEEADSSLSS